MLGMASGTGKVAVPADLLPPEPPTAKPRAAAPPKMPAKPPKEALAAAPAPPAETPAPAAVGTGGRVGNSSWASCKGGSTRSDSALTFKASVLSGRKKVSDDASVANTGAFSKSCAKCSASSSAKASWSVMGWVRLDLDFFSGACLG